MLCMLPSVHTHHLVHIYICEHVACMGIYAHKLIRYMYIYIVVFTFIFVNMHLDMTYM